MKKKYKVKKDMIVFYITSLDEIFVWQKCEFKDDKLLIHTLGNRTEQIEVDLRDFVFIGFT